MAQAQAAQIEYTIYTFDMPKTKKADSSWKKHSTLDDMGRAINEAESLHQSQKYQKIEVKKKFFDQKKNRVVDMTLKIYESKPRKDNTVLFAALVAIVGSAAAFAASFFLTHTP